MTHPDKVFTTYDGLIVSLAQSIAVALEVRCDDCACRTVLHHPFYEAYIRVRLYRSTAAKSLSQRLYSSSVMVFIADHDSLLSIERHNINTLKMFGVDRKYFERARELTISHEEYMGVVNDAVDYCVGMIEFDSWWYGVSSILPDSMTGAEL